MGTLVELDAPVERLRRALREWNVERDSTAVGTAFKTEIAYYLENKLAAHLGEQSIGFIAFLESAGVDIDPAEFAPAFVSAMVFRPLAGSLVALERLRAAGLALACISDWDIGLREQLAKSGLDHVFTLVLTSAEAGAEKPDPAIFAATLERLGVEPGRALHVGDGEADRKAAAAAGLAFEPVPLATVPERVGLR